ncbi:serine/threonine phosphatase [Pseudanabaena sp. FACHB-2040]|uniref:serine/threonine phosphatase n=1 Tax=Pseudanabaena sp. FACHB-2040 TaxID=2692859 RepID=UPI001687619B|nr:serine/threonine phosphatase [Pseudanabaena sp. FACHB-2040]MBD2258858.1 serine/threonine phosphatase [Pseudanabaena sp. FACHB-2040]
MLICPHCTFENPDQNRFCQQCGYALQVWRVLVMPRPSLGHLADGLDQPVSWPQEPEVERLETSETSTGGETQAPTLVALFPEYPYLDAQHRYQLQEGKSEQPVTETTALTVIDCQPAVESPLAKLQARGLRHPDQDWGASDLVASLPQAAIPYLSLQSQFFPIVPTLQAAWEDSACTVLLLEDRWSWSLLGDMWKLGAVDPLQQLHWFYKMAELWDALAQWQAQVSLLDLTNLRVDEDQIFCLAYLKHDPSNAVLELPTLGQIWQTLIEPAQEAVPPELKTVIDHLAAGKIASVSDLQTQIVQLVDIFQATAEVDLPLDDVKEDAGEPIVMPTDLPELEIDDRLEPDLEYSLDTSQEALGEDTAPADGLEESEENLDLPTMVLPMKIVRLDEAGRTHVGRQRDHNEDFFSAQTESTKLEGPQGTSLNVKGLYILCDGMGGHASGEVASSLAVRTLQNHFAESPATLPEEDALAEAVAAANQAIYEINQEGDRSGHGRMGTTLVMLMLHNDRAVVAHVGDSRLYCYTRRLGLKQVTVDHEVGQREIQRGVEPAIAYARPDAYQLTQALGPRSSSDLRPGISFLDIAEDTLFILCSDGLSDNDLLELHCTTHIEPLLHSKADLEEGTNRLIELANEHNGHDNITAILIRIKLRPNMDKVIAA